MKIIFLLLSVLIAATAQNLTSPEGHSKKLYVCPRYFVRIGRRCYFFSRNSATWQEAFYQCRDRNSNFAIIKTANQDKRIRKILSRPTHAFRERWLGGMYNWKQMKWLWAASGKPLTYLGFGIKNFTENQKWHCLVMDPEINYRWNTKPCIEKKPYICHTKVKVVTETKHFVEYARGNDVNEIPIPDAISHGEPSNLKMWPSAIQFKNGGYDMGRFSRRQKRRRMSRRKKKINNTTILLHRPKYRDMHLRGGRYHDNTANKTSSINPKVDVETIKYEIYKEDNQPRSSLYPKPIVEEYSYVRNNSTNR